MLVAIPVVCGCIVATVILIRKRPQYSEANLERLWHETSYQTLFTESSLQLKDFPLSPGLLKLRGFSAYQLAVAQINQPSMLDLIDTCIFSLRKFFLVQETDGASRYVLGKAYALKGPSFADSVIQFLETARREGYDKPDIDQYLGRAYSQLNDLEKSAYAFSQACTLIEFSEQEPFSGDLFIATAESYIKLGDFNRALQYLTRCIETSRDSLRIQKAHFLSGEIMQKTGNFSRAEAHYRAVIENGGENAQTRYQLGELYAAQNNVVQARSEWRRALQIDPSHQQARERLR
jgi:tetratricopeptide (TPR) repeat protein